MSNILALSALVILFVGAFCYAKGVAGNDRWWKWAFTSWAVSLVLLFFAR